MTAPLRVLIIEDSESDAALIARQLAKGGFRVESTRVETGEEFSHQLRLGEDAWDVIIADYRLPSFDAPAALAILKHSALDIPFIVVSGVIGEETAVRLMKSGAHDFLMKNNYTRLLPAVERECGEARSRRARRQAEAEARESAERLHTALSAARMGVWEWDLVSDGLHWSLGSFEKFGSAEFGPTIDAFSQLVHPGDRERLRNEASAAITNRSALVTEYRLISNDESAWVAVRGECRYSDDGQPLRMVGTISNITSTKTSEEELLFSRTMLNSVVSFALDPVVVVDPHGKIALWNRAAENLFGYPTAEAVGMSLEQLVPPQHRDIYRTGLAEFSATGKAGVFGRLVQMTALRRDGNEFPVELNFGPLPIRGAMHAVGVVRDISERKFAEAMLHESEQRWQFALESSGDGVWEWNPATNQTYFSRQWKAMLGYAEDEIDDRFDEFAARVHPDDLADVRAALDKHCRDLTPNYSAEYRLRRKDGAYVQVLGRGRVVRRDEHGNPLRMIGTLTDLTAVKAAEAERERLRAQFLQSQKMESIGRLAGGVAHDFNNLLTVINGYSALLASRLEVANPMRESIEQILAAGERAAALVRQLLTFSRKRVTVSAPVDLNHVVEKLGKTLLRLVGEDIKMSTLLDAHAPPVMSDRNQVEQLLLNLVVNARDAMPQGGKLTIETHAGHVDGHCVLCKAPIAAGNYVSLTVRDTGTGMDENTLAHLFEPFFTTKPVGQGTGLGLSVVHGIITQNGGHLMVRTGLGQGSEFQVLFPLVASAASWDQAGSASAVSGSESLLLVDDDAGVRKYLMRTLAVHGYQVIQAAGAQEALDVLGQRSIDLLVTDVVMPEIGGRELALKALRIQPNLKILMMSGYPGDRFSGPGAPPAAFIQKPFLPHELAAKVRQVLDIRVARGAATSS